MQAKRYATRKLPPQRVKKGEAYLIAEPDRESSAVQSTYTVLYCYASEGLGNKFGN